MFTADAIIDTVQTGKKTFVNTFVTNEAVKESMIKFIDAQADYTKKASKVGMDTATTLTSEAMKQVQEVVKFDYVKAGQEFFKAFQPATSKK
jgi:ATP phosphoribosyltransferase